MRDLTLALGAYEAKRKTKNPATVQRLNLAILAAILILGLVYLFVINSMGTKGFAIKKLEQQLNQLEAEQKTLQIQSSDLQSINKLGAEAQKLNFVPTTNVTYIKASDYALK